MSNYNLDPDPLPHLQLNGVLPASEFVLASDGTVRASDGLATLALRPSSPSTPPPAGNSETSSAPSSPTTAVTERASKSTSSSSSPRNVPHRLGSKSPRETLSGNVQIVTETAVNGTDAIAAPERPVFSFPASFLQAQATNDHVQSPSSVRDTRSRHASACRRRATMKPRKDDGVRDWESAMTTATRTSPAIGGKDGNKCEGEGEGVGRSDLSHGVITHSRPKHETHEASQRCVMPPLPLAPSLQTLTGGESFKSPTPSNVALQAPVGVVVTTATAGVVAGAKGGRAKSDRTGADTCVTIPPSRRVAVSDMELPASADRPPPAESPFVSPPLPPPRLTARRRSSLRMAAPAVLAPSAARSTKNVATNIPSTGGMVRTSRNRAHGFGKVQSATATKGETENRDKKDNNTVPRRSGNRNDIGKWREELMVRGGCGDRGRWLASPSAPTAAATMAKEAAKKPRE